MVEMVKIGQKFAHVIYEWYLAKLDLCYWRGCLEQLPMLVSMLDDLSSHLWPFELPPCYRPVSVVCPLHDNQIPPKAYKEVMFDRKD